MGRFSHLAGRDYRIQSGFQVLILEIFSSLGQPFGIHVGRTALFLITGAMKEAPQGDVASGLNTASELLAGDKKKSGSADMYAKGLAQAAEYYCAV